MAKRADEAMAVGKKVMDGIKEAAREAAADSPIQVGPVANQETMDIINEVANQHQEVSLAIKRRNVTTGKWAALNGIQGIDPVMFRQSSLEDILRDWSGGGEYEVVIKAEGIKPRKVKTMVEGKPLDPKPEREAMERMGVVSGNGAGTPNHGWQNPPAGGWGGPPAMFQPGAYTVPNGGRGYLGGQGFGWGQPQQPQVDPTMQLLIAAMIGNKDRGSRDDDDPRLKEMERMIADERRRNEQLIQEMREERRAADQRQFQEALIAKMSENKPQENALKDYAPIIAAALPALLNKEDSTTTAITNAFSGLMTAQANSSTQNLELLKLMMDRPGPDDKMNNMVGAFSNLMSTMSGSMVGVMQNLLNEKPDHPVVQILSQLIEAGAMVGRAAFGSGEEGEEGIEPEHYAQAQVAPPLLEQAPAALPQDGAMGQLPSYTPPSPEETAQAQAQAIAQDEGTIPEDSLEETDDGEVLDINKDHAFAAIFDRIMNGGDVKDICVRLFRHAGGVNMERQGHKIAKAWFMDPVQVGQHIMVQYGVPNERILQITRGVDELKAYLRNGGDPDVYAPDTTKRQKRRVSSLDPSLTGDTHGTKFDPDRAHHSTPPPPAEARGGESEPEEDLQVPEVVDEAPEELETAPEAPDHPVETPSL